MGLGFFPHQRVRPVQKDVLENIQRGLSQGKHLIIHAPTGIGKTAAVLAPALEHALSKHLRLLFLTSRHTQHKIVIDTLRKIKGKCDANFNVVDLIGKRWMCSQKGAQKLHPAEFFEYCKTMREHQMCSYYSNLKLKGKLVEVAIRLATEVRQHGPLDCEALVKRCQEIGICPYEFTLLLAKDADVIVGDYSYVFNPTISSVFFSKLNIGFEEAIIVVDEGHNLPQRLRDILSDSLSALTIKSALRELKSYGRDELYDKLNRVYTGFLEVWGDVEGEVKCIKQDFIGIIESVGDYNSVWEELESFARIVREEKQRSWCGGVAKFMENWLGPDEGFVRFVRQTNSGVVLYYKGLDPGLLSKEVIASSYSTIMISGTLTPTGMFKDMLGFPDNTMLLEYDTPFPKENRLSLIVPVTSTRYKTRGVGEYKRIAAVCSEIIDAIPGNVAVYFPSYKLRDDISNYLAKLTSKQLLYEKPGMSKQEKQALLQEFIALRNEGGVLLGVVRGSFGEGIDLPGDFLKGVIVVGLPLGVPDIETQALIEYFDKSYGKGQEYGYIYPAINLALQSAGRCIRSERDKGVVVFLDERYAYPRYKGCFPKEWHFIVTRNPCDLIKDFFLE